MGEIFLQWVELLGFSMSCIQTVLRLLDKTKCLSSYKSKVHYISLLIENFVNYADLYIILQQSSALPSNCWKWQFFLEHTGSVGKWKAEKFCVGTIKMHGFWEFPWIMPLQGSNVIVLGFQLRNALLICLFFFFENAFETLHRCFIVFWK